MRAALFSEAQMKRLRERQRNGWAVAFPWADEDALVENLLAVIDERDEALALLDEALSDVYYAEQQSHGQARSTLSDRIEALLDKGSDQ